MNILRYELKTYLFSTLIWIVFIIVFFLAFMTTFPLMKEAEELMRENIIASGISVEALSSAGFNIEYIFTFLGYFSSFFLYVLLLGSIKILGMSISIFSKDTNGSISDFIFSKPVKRKNVFIAKLLICLIYIILINILFFTFSIIIGLAYDSSIDIKKLLIMCLNLLGVQFLSLAIGILLAVSLKKVKSVITLASVAGIGFYVLYMIASITDIWFLKVITPFGLFSPNNVLETGYIKNENIIIGIILFFLLLLTSYFLYTKKDIKL